jgi:uncharacterized repeat protein (TIGR03843 family)
VSALELSSRQRRELLRDGRLEVLGRMPWSSNATLLATVSHGEVEMAAIYKPRRGERPLWDFPTGTLCEREVAAFELSDALGWDLVPETVLRDGPLGVGAVQRFVDHDPDEHYFTLFPDHHERFMAFAVFDVLANNADRKSGHCLRERNSGAIVGIDHGLTFHNSWKLRTVIWDLAGMPVPPDVADRITDACGRLDSRLGSLLSADEIESVRARARALLAEGSLPVADDGYGSFPWPLV